MPVDIGALNRSAVLGNAVTFGSINANRSHYEDAAAALAKTDPAWLADLVTRRVPLADVADAFARHDGDVKVVLDLQPDRP